MTAIVLDGPMGTELGARGVALPSLGWSAQALETDARVVREIHADYARAGAEVHRANTFRTQPHVFPDRWRALVATAMACLRDGIAEVDAATAATRRFAGSMAPVEDCYRPDLSPPPNVAREWHGQMAFALRDAGVDLIVCETFPHAGEAMIAVEEAVKTDLPVWLALTAGPDAGLMSPEVMECAARDGVAAGASSVLVNCTAASRVLPYVDRLARIGVPFGAYANAGDPSEGLGWAADPRLAADRYAELAARWADAGASILGACCGAGPLHIRALASRFGSRSRS